MNKGLTLIEVLMACALLCVGAGLGFEAYRLGCRRFKSIAQQASAERLGSAAQARISRDLRCAAGSFVGRKHEMSFSGITHKTDDEVGFLYFDGHHWRQEWGWDAEFSRPMTGIQGLPYLVKLNGHTYPVMTALLNHANE